MVVPASLLDSIGRFQGFCDDSEKYLSEMLKSENVSFRPRGEVEEDPSLKQLIPYCLLCHEGSVFRYTRGKKMGEKRLHALESIGVGGHISQDDEHPLFGSARDTYLEGMDRELNEEVEILSEYTQECVGLINDDATPVGEVHLGIVHRFELRSPDVKRREQGLTGAGFIAIDALVDRKDRLETWSQFALECLIST